MKLIYPVLAALSCGLGLAAQSGYHAQLVDPKGTFLRTDPGDPAASPLIIDLAALGLQPGQRLRIRATGDFDWITGASGGQRMVAVFSADQTVLGRSMAHRVVGALSCNAPAYPTGPTYNQSLPNDIPEDFVVDRLGLVVDIPAAPGGATPFLLIGADDVFWSDNTDSNQDFRVVLGDADAAFGLSFDGVDDIARTSSFVIPRVFTIEVFVSAQASGWCQLAGGVGGQNRCDHGVGIYANGARYHACFDLPPCGGQSIAMSPEVGPAFVHVAATFDGTHESLFVDGTRVVHRSWPAVPHLNGFGLGGALHLATNQFANCRIAEARVWSVARSPTQIATTAALRTADPNDPDLVALYLLDEGSGQVAHDATPNGHHLMLGLNTSAESRDPVWIAEPTGQTQALQGTLDGLLLATGVDATAPSIVPRRKSVAMGTTLGLQVTSTVSAFDQLPVLLALEVFAGPAIAPTAIPGLHIDVFGPQSIIVFDGVTPFGGSGIPTVMPSPATTAWTFPLPVLPTGIEVVIQAAALSSQAANGVFAASPAHVLSW